MMNEFEAYIVELLQGNLAYEDKTVQVVKQFSQHPERPVVTLDIQSVTTQRILNDPSLAEKYYEYKSDININLWCDNEKQRQQLTNQILDCFYKEQTYHYKYCEQYTGGTCKTLKSECTAVKAPHNRCKSPDTLGFSSLQYRHNIIPGTLIVDPPFELDEVSEHPPLLRSVFRCEAQYSVALGTASLIQEVKIGDVGIPDDEAITHLPDQQELPSTAPDNTDDDGVDIDVNP